MFHLGGVGPRVAGTGAGQAADQMRYGSLSLFHLLRTGRADRVAVVTSDVYAVAGSAVENPFSAGMHGLLQVGPKERPGLEVLGVDFAAADVTGDAGAWALADAILAEPLDGTGRTVALRGGIRYLRRLGRVGLPEAGPVFRDDGVYLLIGGTGGIARELSTHLARTHRSRLVWFSRGEPGPEQQDTIDVVRAHGGDVAHVRGDACSAEDLAAAVAEAHRRFGALHGVVHAAMVFDDHPLTELDEAAFTSVTRVKTEGAAALAAAVAEEPLDFLAFFSSAGSFGGFAGNGAYICASATEDAYALFLRERLAFPVTVINQGYWGHVGSGDRPGLAEIFTGLGISAFSAAGGIAAVRRILGSGLPQVMPIRANHRALEAMGHDPAYDGEAFGGGHPPTLADAATRLDAGADTDPAAARVSAGYGELEAVSAPMLLGVYQRMGVFRRSGERHHAEELGGRLRVLDKYRRLHEALLNILAGEGFLTRDGDRVVTSAAVDAVDQAEAAPRWEAEFDRIARAYPDIEPTVTLNRLFLREYPRILRGEVGATEIMFPGSSMKLVQNFYKGNPLTDSFNRHVRETVRCFLDVRLPQLPDAGTIQVVELGAARVPPVSGCCPRWPTTRDVSATRSPTSHRASWSTAANASPPVTPSPGSRCSTWSADWPSRTSPASADLVLATNVVHATSNLRATLRKAKALLRPGGWLVLNELTSVRPLLTIGGGPLDGWWLFDDAELRLPDSPLASPESWTRLLHEEGYTPVRALGAEGAGLGQTVLVAESDGVVLGAVPATALGSVSTAVPTDAADAVGDRLRELVERVLKLDERIDPDRPLADYGFDSLSGMKIVSAVDEAFGVTVPLGDFFERPTLRELSAHLASSWLADAAAPPPSPEPPKPPEPPEPPEPPKAQHLRRRGRRNWFCVPAPTRRPPPTNSRRGNARCG